MRRPAIAAALLLTALSYPALAQSPAEHEEHDTGTSPPSMQATPPATQPGGRPGAMGNQDMMGMDMIGRRMMRPGMMGHGMMGQEAMGGSMMFRMVFALMDADGDGTVSLPEFQAAHERIFKAMDSNKDGKLTPEEMKTFMH